MTDIADLPEPGSTSRSEPSAQRDEPLPTIQLTFAPEESAGSAVQPAVAFEPTRGKPEVFAPTSRYDYDPQYKWIRGKLEYSQIARQWKLRYIPIDGETDQFGGSVILSDTSLLSGYERGDFVEVHGRLESTSATDSGYSPEYHISQIKRLGG
jgi:hypothetical protein